MSAERWLPVPGFEGLYEVSDLGRVKSHHGRSPRILRPSIAPNGRHAVSLCPGRDTRRIYLLVLEAFVDPRPDGAEGCHNNGDPGDDRLTNLRWDSVSANRLDTVRHGRHNHATGSAHADTTCSHQTCICRKAAEHASPAIGRPPTTARPYVVACLPTSKASRIVTTES